MKKLKLISSVLAVLLMLTVCIVACDNGGVGDHEHVWDGGEITTAPTCYSEGVKTFHCTVEKCEQTKTEPVQTTSHSWDAGTETKQAACNQEGEITYKCTNQGCNATKTQPVSKTEHSWDNGVITASADFATKGVRTYTCQYGCGSVRQVYIDAQADFVDGFCASQDMQSQWLYGVANQFDAQTGNFAFAQATLQNGVWQAAGVEITSGKVSVTNAQAAIAYTFTENLPKLCQAAFTVKFDGVVRAYIIIKSADGQVKVFRTLNDTAAAVDYVADIDADAADVVKGDTLYLVLDSGNTAAEGALAFTVYAPCLHIWSDAITQKPDCTHAGVKTYTCVNDNCGEHYEEEIPATGHNWDSGVVTREPTEEADGEMTFRCTNEGCAETRTESIPKLEHIEYEDFANFGNDFEQTLQGKSNWQVGKVDYIWAQENFTFTALTEKSSEAFTNNEPWMEVKGDWMANNGMVGLAYRFTKSVRARFIFTLNAVSNSKFSLRWALKSGDGTIKTNEGKASWGGDSSPNTVTSELTVVAGDTLYMLVNKEDSADNQCSFSFVIQTPHSDTSEVTFDFADDFAQTLNGTSKWSVGIANYSWDGGESFTVTPITQKSADAFIHSDPNFEIKGDWMAINGMAALAFKFDYATTSNFRFTLNGGEGGVFAVRWALTDANGNVKTNNGIPTWGDKARNVDIAGEVTAQANDILYVLINKEETGDQCNFTFTVTAEAKPDVEPDVEPEWSDKSGFADEFQATLDGTSNWTVGKVDYIWEQENFTFTTLTDKNEAGDAFTNGEPWMEVKGDWMAIQAMVGFAYKFDVAGTAHFDLHLRGVDVNSAFTARWALKDADGNIKTNGGKASFVDNNRELRASEDLEIAENDVLYILIQKEKDSDQCNFAITVTTEAEPDVEPEWSDKSGFADEFQATLDGTSNWTVGKVDYIWEQENFTFTTLTDKNEAGDAFTNGEPWMEVKGDWMAIQAMVGFAYKFDVAGTAHFDLHLRGVDVNSAFTARWALKDADGNIKTNGGKASFVDNNRELRASEDLEIAENDVLYILIQKENDYDQCNFAITVTTEAVEYEEIANFGNDFTQTLAGNNNWQVGKVDYNFADGSETFEFTALTEKSADAFINGEPWMEVKGDWMANDDMVGLAYTFDKAATARFTFTLNYESNSRFSVRWALKSADGTIKTNEGKASWGGDSSPNTVQGSFEVQATDVLYVLIKKEETNNQCKFSFVIEATQSADHGGDEPVQPKTSNFNDDFQATFDGTSKWTVGKVGYDWDQNTFTFTALTEKSADAFKNSDPWMEVKGDWMANGGMVGLAYTFDQAASADFTFILNFVGDSKFSVRWALKSADGAIKTNDGIPAWGGDVSPNTVQGSFQVEAGDTLYVLVNHESGGDQCNFEFTVTTQQ